MNSCPEDPNPLNCGLASAKYLVDGLHIELNPQLPKPVIVDELGELALNEVLIYRCATQDEDSFAVYFQCARCLRQVIRISDDSTDLSAEPVGRLF